MIHNFNSNTQKTEAGGSSLVQGQPSLNRESQASQGHKV